MGRFLPFAFVGLAVGRFDYSTTVTLLVTGADSYSGTDTHGKNNAISAGLDTGLGVEGALTSNLFLRGEWQYLAFASISGVRYAANAFRPGVGLKF